MNDNDVSAQASGRWDVQMWANGGRGDDFVLVNTHDPQAPTFHFAPDAGIAARRGQVFLNDLEAALERAQAERDDAVKALRGFALETVEAGYPGGDRDQTYANIRAMRTELTALRAELRQAQSYQPLLSQMTTRAGELERELQQAREERDREVLIALDFKAALTEAQGKAARYETALRYIESHTTLHFKQVAHDALTTPATEAKRVCRFYPNEPCPEMNVHCRAPDCMVPATEANDGS